MKHIYAYKSCDMSFAFHHFNYRLSQLDALHVLDASAHFDAGSMGRNTF